jgi:RNA polymerase sigma-70 factor, ECF subfamily
MGEPRLLEPESLGDHLDRLYRAALAYCKGSHARADDLVQDTYLRVLSRPRFVRGDDDLAYLLRVLRNTYISQLRSAASRPPLATGDEPDWIEDGSVPQPHDIVESRLVYEVIAELPPDFRDALVAVDVVGLRYREAAHALGVPESTLTTRLFRARERAAKALGPELSAEGRVSPRRASLSRIR